MRKVKTARPVGDRAQLFRSTENRAAGVGTPGPQMRMGITM